MTEAVQLREEIIAVKAHLAKLYDRRAVLMKRMCRTRTTREVAEVFGVKQPLVVNTLRRSQAMPYVNVGIYDATTKAALKQAVKDDPSKVRAYGTSDLGPQWSGRVSDLPEGYTLSVTGPDPYRSRKWYASIKRTGDRIKVT